MLLKYNYLIFISLSFLIFFTISAQGDTIHESAKKGDLKNIDALLKNNPELIHKKNEDGLTCLRIAIYSDRDYVVEYLLDHGAETDWISACYLGQLDRAKELLKNDNELIHQIDTAGIKYSYKIIKDIQIVPEGTEGLTSLQIATYQGHHDLSKFLISQGATVDIHSACYLGMIDEIKNLLKENPDYIKKIGNRSGLR